MKLLLIILSVYATLQYRVILAQGKSYLPSRVHEIECLDGDTLKGTMTWKTVVNNKIDFDLYLFKEGSTIARGSFESFSFQKQQFTFQISGAGKYIMKPLRKHFTINETAKYQIELVKAGVNYSFSGTFGKQFDTYQINATNQAGAYEKINLKIQIPSPYYLGLSVDFLDQGKTKYSNIFNTYYTNRTQNFDVSKLQCSGNMSFRLKWTENPILISRLISYNFTISYEVPDSPAPSQNYTLLLKGVHTFPNYFYKIQCQQGEILKGIVHWSQKSDLDVEYYEEGQKLNWIPQLEFESNSTENETIELLVNKTGTHYFQVRQLKTNNVQVPFEIQLSCGTKSVQNSGAFYKNYKQTDLIFLNPDIDTCSFRLTYTKLSNKVSTSIDNFYIKANLQNNKNKNPMFLGPSEISKEGIFFDFAVQKDSKYQSIEFPEGISSNSEYFQYEFMLEHPSSQAGCQQKLYYPNPNNYTTPPQNQDHQIDQEEDQIDQEDQQIVKNQQQTVKNKEKSGQKNEQTVQNNQNKSQNKQEIEKRQNEQKNEKADYLESGLPQKNGQIAIESIVGFSIGCACILAICVLCCRYHKHFFSRVKPLQQVSREYLHQTSELDVCSICFDIGLNGSLPCGHNFHLRCIMSWLSRNHHCPNCRVESRISDVRQRISN